MNALSVPQGCIVFAKGRAILEMAVCASFAHLLCRTKVRKGSDALKFIFFSSRRYLQENYKTIPQGALNCIATL